MRVQVLVGMQVEHALGHIVFRNLEEKHIDGAAVLLSRSFAGKDWKSLEEVRCVISGFHRCGDGGRSQDCLVRSHGQVAKDTGILGKRCFAAVFVAIQVVFAASMAPVSRINPACGGALPRKYPCVKPFFHRLLTI